MNQPWRSDRSSANVAWARALFRSAREIQEWEGEGEHRAAGGIIARFDPALMILDDPLANRESQPCALALAIRGQPAYAATQKMLHLELDRLRKELKTPDPDPAESLPRRVQPRAP